MILIKLSETRYCSLCSRNPGKTALVGEIIDDNSMKSILFCSKHLRFVGPEIEKFLDRQRRVRSETARED